jgi:uncharacterized repeat protein (TIGR02543 family)
MSQTDVNRMNVKRRTNLVCCTPVYYAVQYVKNKKLATGAQTDPLAYLSGQEAVVLDQGSMVLPGFRFLRWNTRPGGEGVAYDPGDIVKVFRNVWLYAQWGELYRVYYDTNHPTATGEQVDLTERIQGEIAVVSNRGSMARPGYRFVGWNTSPGGDGAAYQPGDLLLIPGNVTLYAQWSELFRVYYNANNPTATGEQVDLTERIQGEIAVVLDRGTIEYSYVIGPVYHWNTEPDDSGTLYYPGDTLVVLGNVTLYLIATDIVVIGQFVNYYTANINATGGQYDPNMYFAGDTVTVLDQGTIYDPNANFLYWTDIAGLQIYYPGTTFILPAGFPGLYAKYDAEVADY